MSSCAAQRTSVHWAQLLTAAAARCRHFPCLPQGEVNLDTTTFSHSARDMHVTVEKPEDGYMSV